MAYGYSKKKEDPKVIKIKPKGVGLKGMAAGGAISEGGADWDAKVNRNVETQGAAEGTVDLAATRTNEHHTPDSKRPVKMEPIKMAGGGTLDDNVAAAPNQVMADADMPLSDNDIAMAAKDDSTIEAAIRAIIEENKKKGGEKAAAAIQMEKKFLSAKPEPMAKGGPIVTPVQKQMVNISGVENALKEIPGLAEGGKIIPGGGSPAPDAGTAAPAMAPPAGGAPEGATTPGAEAASQPPPSKAGMFSQYAEKGIPSSIVDAANAAIEALKTEGPGAAAGQVQTILEDLKKQSRGATGMAAKAFKDMQADLMDVLNGISLAGKETTPAGMGGMGGAKG